MNNGVKRRRKKAVDKMNRMGGIGPGLAVNRTLREFQQNAAFRGHPQFADMMKRLGKAK